MIGTMSSYSVYQLSEALSHKHQFVECESDAQDLLILDDPGVMGSHDRPVPQSNASYMTGIQDMYGDEDGEIEDDDGFRYDGNHASYEARSPQDISSQRNKTLMKKSGKKLTLQQQSMG